MATKKSQNKEVRDSKIATMLLEGLALERKKGEVYLDVFTNIEEYKFKIERDASGTPTWKWVNEDAFKQNGGITGRLTREFSCWPKGEDKKLLSFNAVNELRRKDASNLSVDQHEAFKAINNFSNWCNGFRLTELNAAKDKVYQDSLKAAQKAELDKLSDKDKKNPEMVKAAAERAKKSVQKPKAGKNAPRIVASKNGEFKPDAFKALSADQKTGVAIGIAKADSDLVIKALKEAGKEVVPVSTLKELRAEQLLNMLEEKIGEFHDAKVAYRYIENLKDLLVSIPSAKAKTTMKPAGKQKAVNA